MTSNFTPGNIAAVRSRIAGAFRNISTAMRNAGYADTSWTLLVQTYPSPIPRGSGIRYSQSGYSRQFTGGCGFNGGATRGGSCRISGTGLVNGEPRMVLQWAGRRSSVAGLSRPAGGSASRRG